MDDLLLQQRTQLIGSGACLLAFLLLKRFAGHLVRSAILRSSFKSKEEREVMRLIHLLLLLVLAIGLTAVWGVKQSELLLFAASALTVLGVALFAEMSILSNVTAFLVPFFQHPVKIGDHIILKDDEHDLEGELEDITYFFTFVRRSDGSLITVPNATLLKSAFTITQPRAR